jgi:hypothetical protein
MAADRGFNLRAVEADVPQHPVIGDDQVLGSAYWPSANLSGPVPTAGR